MYWKLQLLVVMIINPPVLLAFEVASHSNLKNYGLEKNYSSVLQILEGLN
jgi:hypothetical protein